MTDDDVIRRAQCLCDRGVELPNAHLIDRARLRNRVNLDEDGLEACYIVPALLELIERRGLR